MSYMFSCSDENNRAKAIGMRLRRLRGEMKQPRDDLKFGTRMNSEKRSLTRIGNSPTAITKVEVDMQLAQ